MDQLDDNILLGCGFCNEVNLFQDYGWEPPPEVLPPDEVEDGCDWNVMDTCDDKKKKSKSKKKDDDDDRYPMCIWDENKGEGKSKCQKVSKLDSLKGHEYLAGCGYCEDVLL